MDTAVRLIDLEKVQTSDIWNVLSDYYVEGWLGKDGDVYIDRSITFYIRVDRRYSMLRFFCYFGLKTSQDDSGLSDDVKTLNGASSSVKYSVMSTAVVAEYGIPLFGCIDHKHLLKVVDHFDGEIKTASLVLRDFVEG